MDHLSPLVAVIIVLYILVISLSIRAVRKAKGIAKKQRRWDDDANQAVNIGNHK